MFHSELCGMFDEFLDFLVLCTAKEQKEECHSISPVIY